MCQHPDGYTLKDTNRRPTALFVGNPYEDPAAFLAANTDLIDNLHGAANPGGRQPLHFALPLITQLPTATPDAAQPSAQCPKERRP